MNVTKWNVKRMGHYANNNSNNKNIHTTRIQQFMMLTYKAKIVFNVVCFQSNEWATQMEKINSKFEQPLLFNESDIQLVCASIRTLLSVCEIRPTTIASKSNFQYDAVVCIDKATNEHSQRPTGGFFSFRCFCIKWKYARNILLLTGTSRQSINWVKIYGTDFSLIRWKIHSYGIALLVLFWLLHILVISCYQDIT